MEFRYMYLFLCFRFPPDFAYNNTRQTRGNEIEYRIDGAFHYFYRYRHLADGVWEHRFYLIRNDIFMMIWMAVLRTSVSDWEEGWPHVQLFIVRIELRLRRVRVYSAVRFFALFDEIYSVTCIQWLNTYDTSKHAQGMV